MGGDRHLDINKAVSQFLKNFERLPGLPFVADADMLLLFGEEPVRALAELNQYSQEEKHCQNCTQRCCLLVDCELYSTNLTKCPVQSFRPALCRMHFCTKFTQLYKYLVKDIGDIFLESLLAAGKINSRIAELFDSPALLPLAPSLVESIQLILDRVKSGSLEENTARLLIQVEIEEHRARRDIPVEHVDPLPCTGSHG